jgi:hypothetical protein
MVERATLHPVQSTVIALPPLYVSTDSRATPAPFAAFSTPLAAYGGGRVFTLPL